MEAGHHQMKAHLGRGVWEEEAHPCGKKEEQVVSIIFYTNTVETVFFSLPVTYRSYLWLLGVLWGVCADISTHILKDFSLCVANSIGSVSSSCCCYFSWGGLISIKFILYSLLRSAYSRLVISKGMLSLCNVKELILRLWMVYLPTAVILLISRHVFTSWINVQIWKLEFED